MKASWLAFALVLLSLAPASACSDKDPCRITNGQYYERAPQGWDGASPLPVAVFFPGYGVRPQDVMNNEEIGKVFSDLGVLFVVPESEGGRWHIPVWGGQDRDDLLFVRNVMENIRERHPVDERRLLATGFSLGASMVWYLACQSPERFTAYVGFSGSFWEPLPARCAQGPVQFLQIHGTTDPTMPLEGRSVGGGRARQGNVFRGLEVVRSTDACDAARHRQESRTLPDGSAAQCEIDPACAGGSRVEACFHPGGHYVDAAWFKTAWAFLQQAVVLAAVR